MKKTEEVKELSALEAVAWLKVYNGTEEMQKVFGYENISDVLTEFSSEEILRKISFVEKRKVPESQPVLMKNNIRQVLRVETPIGPLEARAILDEENPFISLVFAKKGSGEPGALMTYSQGQVKLMVYSREHPDDDPTITIPMSWDNDLEPENNQEPGSISEDEPLDLRSEDTTASETAPKTGYAKISTKEQKYSEKPVKVDMNTDKFSVEGHFGTWHTIDSADFYGRKIFLMEHDFYGDDAAGIAVTEDGELVAEDLWNGLDKECFEAIEEYFEDKMSKSWKSLKFPPIYMESGLYARSNNELHLFRASAKENENCRYAIEEAIRKYFDGAHLCKYADFPVLEQFGEERTAFVLATTIKHFDWDRRFSAANRMWAATIQTIDSDISSNWIVSSHAAVLNGFIDQFRDHISCLNDARLKRSV